MRKEDKGTIIAQIADTVKEYSCFYLAETATLNAEKTSNLRRACFKEGIKMLVVKNALLHKALEGLDADYSPLYGALKGSTTMFFSNVGNAPAKLIKEFRKKNNLTQSNLANLMRTTQDTISLWELGKSYPDAENIVRMAKLFRTSSDYLLCLTNDPTKIS